MTNNVFALQLKANSEEFESKKQDLKRLQGTLQSFLNEVTKDNPSRWRESIRATLGSYKGSVLGAEIRFDSWGLSGSNSAKITLIAGDCVIEKDEQYDLEIVRIAWDNMDTIVASVRQICHNLGCWDELNAKFQRFMM